MAGAQDAATLASKYRGKGQSDEQVYNTLRSLGYSQGDARGAVGGLGSGSRPPTKRGAGPGAPTKPAAPAGQQTPAPSAAGGSGPLGGMPSIKAPDLSSLTLTPPKKLNAGDVGGFLAGLLAYVLFLNYLTHGKAGVTGWFSAKFLNEPVDLDTAPKTSRRRNRDDGLTSTRPAKPTAV